MLTNDSRLIWKVLNGVICIYKPAEVTSNQIRKQLMTKITAELCEMQCRPVEKYVKIEGNTNHKLTVSVQDSYADHPLVVGPRYVPEDVRCTWATYLGKITSGVMLYGVNSGTKDAFYIRKSRPTRAYRISGKFGEATDNFFKDGEIMERSTYNHIKRTNIDRLLAHMQAIHQRKMFEYCGVNMNSQAGYELAIQGPIRPADSKIPVIYGIKCVYLEPPYFTIEIQCINEYETYLKTLIHDIGMQMKSTAHCISIQCIRHSYFGLDDALLSKHWTLQNIVKNMEMCNRRINDHDLTKQKHAALQ